MKRAAPLFFLFLLLVSPAGAQNHPQSNAFIQQMTAYFQKLANGFGCTAFGFNNFEQPIGVIEFLPPDDSFPNWSRMFTANIVPLPRSESQVARFMDAFRKQLLDTFLKEGTVLDVQDFKTGKGLPVTYIEYRAGSGAVQEHAVGVYARHAQAISAFTQLQVRGGPLSEIDKAAMKKLAEKMTQQ